MAASVGAAALSKAFVGDVPVKKIFVGEAQVWPDVAPPPVLTTKLVWVDSRASTAARR